jgi:hypothetical protein
MRMDNATPCLVAAMFEGYTLSPEFFYDSYPIKEG